LGQLFTARPMPSSLRSEVKADALGASLGLLGVAFVMAVAGAKVASSRLQSDLCEPAAFTRARRGPVVLSDGRRLRGGGAASRGST
jgi:hypothetical protein